jgi:multimeric flavodoxin WrbA
MSITTVVVTFYSRGGSTESLAHAAAVGAVQARALIRLRRMPDADEAAIVERLVDCRDSLRRMHREYVAPREADVLAAHALVIGSPADLDPSSPEWAAFVDLLRQLQAEGKLAGKVAAVIATGPSSDAFATVVRQLGFATITEADIDASGEMDDVGRAVALGRKAALAAQAAKSTS